MWQLTAVGGRKPQLPQATRVPEALAGTYHTAASKACFPHLASLIYTGTQAALGSLSYHMYPQTDAIPVLALRGCLLGWQGLSLFRAPALSCLQACV